MNEEIESAERALQDRIAQTVGRWPTIVCFANDWTGDPTSKHHIMRTYAAATDVVWVESSGMRRPKLSSLMDLRRVTQRLSRAAAAPRRQPEGRLRVASPLAIPLPGNPIANRINTRLYQRAIRRASIDMKRGAPLLWVYTPTVAPYLEHYPHAGIVYHCVDRWWAFRDYDPKVMRECHELLCRRANVVFASALALLRDCEPFTSHAHLVPHGVEWKHFARAALEPSVRPADIAGITTPIIGFFGLIHEWLDQELLVHVAKSFPESTIVLIGKVQADCERLQRLPNVRFVGQKPYADLPAYAAAFDVAIIPFVISELTVAVNPIKLREYLSAGLPVVSTALPEIEALRGHPHVHIAETRAQFVDTLRQLTGKAESPQARRAAAITMASESWSGRCLEMARLVDSRVAR